MDNWINFNEYEAGDVIRKERFSYKGISGLMPRFIVFYDCDFRGSWFESATYVLIQFHNCDFTNADFSAATFNSCEFYNCSFTDATLDGTVLLYSEMVNCTFERAKLSNFTLDTLSKVDDLITFKYGSKHQLTYHPTQPEVFIGCQHYTVEEWLSHVGNNIARDFGYEKDTYLIYRAVIQQIKEMKSD